MKIGVVFPQTEFSTDLGGVRAFAEAAQDLGYEYLITADHVLGADPAAYPGWDRPYRHDTVIHEPMVLFAYLAGIAPKLGFMPNVIILPQRQAVLVAKQAAELDLMTNGNFRLGVGIGWNAIEFEGLGMDFKNRARRFEEQIDLMRKLWCETSMSYQGQYHTINSAAICPLPMQRPIPIWIGGIGGGGDQAGLPDRGRVHPALADRRDQRLPRDDREDPRLAARERARSVDVRDRGAADGRHGDARTTGGRRWRSGGSSARRTSAWGRSAWGQSARTRTSSGCARPGRCWVPDVQTPRHSMDPPIRQDWLAQWQEEILEPDLPIVDPHHHLWDVPDWDTRYLLDELLADLDSGHNIVATVFLQCWSMHKADGPEAMQPVGETEFVNGIAAMSASGNYGPTRVCAGIVGTADLRLGERVTEVLEAHIRAGGGRFRGIRHSVAWDAALPASSDARRPACWTTPRTGPASRSSRRWACPSTPGSTIRSFPN